MPVLETARLRLLPLSASAIGALLAGDEARLRALTGAAFPLPVRPPPLTEELLPMVRDRLQADPAQGDGGPGSWSGRTPQKWWARSDSAAGPMPMGR
jgi:hypothetical protein